ncbi:acetoin reductase family protein [Mycena pura]|uniref:Acetoin reductase family protein n=1 Tax=Mycena pura TaxID=153505 RepID=A0AAD6Y870_9AGAR|nr:acetoin reductase family protein [Mycena pura]
MSSKGVALVTGAARGIGKAIALRLADDGFHVAVNDVPAHSELLDALVAEIQQKGRQSSKHVADVAQEQQVKEMVEGAVKQLGGLDVMVANAGVPERSVAGLTESQYQYRLLVIALASAHANTCTVSVEDWDHVLSINARGSFLCYKYAALQMIQQGRGGRIIGASSILGKQGEATQAAYSASKFAVRGLTQVAAQEFGRYNITVNAYSPGMVDTPLIASLGEFGQHVKDRYIELSPLKRVGVPEDIAGLVSYLASKESQFITGQSISINGGLFFD